MQWMNKIQNAKKVEVQISKKYKNTNIGEAGKPDLLGEIICLQIWDEYRHWRGLLSLLDVIQMFARYV